MKKGFTLVEIIAVIILLSVLAMIAVPRIVETIEKSKSVATENQIEVIKDASLLYSVKYDLGYDNNIKKTITFDSLISAGFLNESDILNEKGNRILGCVGYEWLDNAKQYQFWYKSEC